MVVVVVAEQKKGEKDTQNTQNKKKQWNREEKEAEDENWQKCALMAISSFILRYITLFCLMW